MSASSSPPPIRLHVKNRAERGLAVGLPAPDLVCNAAGGGHVGEVRSVCEDGNVRADGLDDIFCGVEQQSPSSEEGAGEDARDGEGLGDRLANARACDFASHEDLRGLTGGFR